MKKISLAVLLSFSLLYSSEFDWEKTDGEVYIGSQSIVNDVIGSTNKIDFINSNQDMGVSGQFISAGDISILNIPLSYSLDEEYSLELTTPVISSKSNVSGDTLTGIGDISLGGSYYFGKPSDKKGSNITTLTYKSTTGAEEKALGSYTSSLTISQRVTKDINDKMQVNGFASYTLDNSADSTLFMIGGSHPCLLSDKVTTSAKITYLHIDSASSVFYTAVESVDLWLGWSSNKLVVNTPLGFGLKLPIINEKGGDSKDKTVLFYLSASSFFDN